MIGQKMFGQEMTGQKTISSWRKQRTRRNAGHRRAPGGELNGGNTSTLEEALIQFAG
jgi:hypothetical protein